MNHLIHRRGVMQLGLTWSIALSLPAARACEFRTDNLTVVHPWVRPTAEATDSATLSMGFKDVVYPDRLIDARTPLARRITMGGQGDDTRIDFEIAAGDESRLTEQGPHLQLLGVTIPLGLGSTFPLQLLFQKAGPIEALLTVDYARFR